MEALQTIAEKKTEKFSEKKMALATIMREELRRREISQSKFAKLMDRHRPEITKWLSGRHNFTLDTLFEIESKLNISFFRYEKVNDLARGQGFNITLPAKNNSGVQETVSQKASAATMAQ
jgi:transcriptional regulator with XRE-family HTH domain